LTAPGRSEQDFLIRGKARIGTSHRLGKHGHYSQRTGEAWRLGLDAKRNFGWVQLGGEAFSLDIPLYRTRREVYRSGRASARSRWPTRRT
jgi:hypothetical protein